MPRPPFPHMMPHDIPLFASFVLSEEGKRYGQWQFDVHVGPGQDLGEGTDPAIRDMGIMLTQLRIDAIGFSGTIPTIFEVKPDARLTALGQVLSYVWYYEREFNERAYKAVITDSMTDQVRALYEAFGIDIFLVKPALPSEILQAIHIVYPNG